MRLLSVSVWSSPSLEKTLVTWASTVRGLRNRSLAIPTFERPSAIRASTSRSRGLSASIRLALRFRWMSRRTMLGSITVSPATILLSWLMRWPASVTLSLSR